MSPETELPELSDAADLDLALAAEEEGQQPPSGLLAKIWYYHPLGLLGFSVMLSIVAYCVYPEKATLKIDDASTMYGKGLATLRDVLDQDKILGHDEMTLKIQQTEQRFEDLFIHHANALRYHPEFINPYMLLGRSMQLYADRFPFEARKKLGDAVWAYGKAEEWEATFPEGDLREKYIKANFSLNPDVLPGTEEIKTRQTRRLRYLRYNRAIIEIGLERYETALSNLEALAQEFEQAELERLRDEVGLAETVEAVNHGESRSILPADFEMTPEDRINLHYYLALAYEKTGKFPEAEREYRIFLLQSPRSEKLFYALMRLGRAYEEQGRAAMRDAAGRRETERDKTLDLSGRLFRAAIDRYTQVVEASAPEKILREAYFRGGIAYLSLAEGMTVGRETWWDVIGREGESVQDILRSFSGKPLPERTRAIPLALGRFLFESGVEIPGPVTTSVQGLAGAMTTLATRPRLTLRAQRDLLLRKARVFFEGAKGGAEGYFTAASQVYIARSLLADGRIDKAREVYQDTKLNYPGQEVEIACRQGIAKTYILEGDLHRARIWFLGGMEKKTSSLLKTEDVNWLDFCDGVIEAESKKERSPDKRVWELLPGEARRSMQHISRTRKAQKEQVETVLSSLNTLLYRNDFYLPEDFVNVRLGEDTLYLLALDRISLDQREIEWLNRLLLENSHLESMIESPKGEVFEPFPPLAELPQGMLVSEDEILSDLAELSRKYVQQADLAEAAGRDATSVKSRREAATRLRRCLVSAADVNGFMLANYHPARGEVLLQTAELYSRLAGVVAGAPFFEEAHAEELTAEAARTYLRVAEEDPGGTREGEALWKAGSNFYSARQYGRVVEALESFVQRYGGSDRGGEAQNLLGRAYCKLGELKKATEVYRDASFRKTPDGRKAIYYLGETFLQMESLAASKEEKVDPVGDPENPLPEILRDGAVQIDSALQAFNGIRRLPGLGPDSRPWRWATFALGPTWFRIAENKRREEEAARSPQNPARPDTWLEYYRNAEAMLRESLERYLLKRSPEDYVGEDMNVAPEDYGEILCARFVSEYFIARTQLVLADKQNDRAHAVEARLHLQDMLDANNYPDIMFDESVPQTLYLAIVDALAGQKSEGGIPRTARLGVSEGPGYHQKYLSSLRRNAYFLLGQSWLDEADQIIQTAPDDETHYKDAIHKAYRVYQAAHDRLSPRDGPYLIYMMAECLKKLGRAREAETKYRLARNAAQNLRDTSDMKLQFIGPEFWQKMATERLVDLQEGFLQ